MFTRLTDTSRATTFTVLVLFMALVAALLLLAASAPPAMAGSIAVDTSPGTSAPPAKLGPYVMTPFKADSRPLFQEVHAVPAPGGAGTLQFDRPMDHRRIGRGWLTWSHGYTGDVYATSGAQVVMTLPANTKAFYFYAEPNDFDTFTVTATANDGTTSGPVAVRGRAGAKYFGFYTTDGSTLSTITVDVDPRAEGFAVGEFGINTTGCTIEGTKGGDLLVGTPRADVICGLGGGDVIRGRGGGDTLRGDGGGDRMVGGGGLDTLRGAGGGDYLDTQDGVRGNDFADGGPGGDDCVADRRDTTISCS